MNGTSIFDVILLIVFVVFIISRFMSHKLPRDDNKKDGSKKHGAPRNSLGKPLDSLRGKSDDNQQDGNVVPLPETAKQAGKQKAAPKTPQKPAFSAKEIENMEGVEKIKAVDPSFDEKEFKQGAKQAYMLYWQAMAERDDETLANLVSPRLLDETMDTIETLEGEDKHRVTRIDKFDSMDIVDTRVSGRTALIDLKYTVTLAQTDVKTSTTTTEAQGKTIQTIWTWARNLADEDPNWELETITSVN